MKPKVAAIFVLSLSLAVAGRESGMAFFHSFPRGANVFVDGEQSSRGRTPLVLTEISTGTHKARFVLDGYQPVEEEFEVAANEAVTIKAGLEPIKPVLTVKAVPQDCQLFVDETEAEAGRPVELDPGKHIVKVQREGYVDWEGEIDLAPGETQIIRVELKRVEAPAIPATQPSVEAPSAGDTTAVPEPAGTGESGLNGGPSSEEEDEVPRFIDVDCWVCEGTGFIQTMGCPTCEGTGRENMWRCRECEGEGRVPARCEVCKGQGMLFRRGKQIECPVCRGSGKPVCPRCKGTGKLKRLNPAAYDGKTRQCPACDGTGRVVHQPCSICEGTGQDPRLRGRRWAARVNIPCYYCRGAREGPPPCRKCRGTGLVGPEGEKRMCPSCAGTGQQEVPCPYCKGNGWIPDKR